MITFSKLGNPEYGRLGNQLFQIAATIGIATNNNTDFVFPKWEYGQYFKNSLPYADMCDLKVYKQKKFNYYDIVLKDTYNYDLRGFFQSERFFIQAENLVRYYMQPSNSVEAYIQNKYGHILNKNTCSIHIRRGDYLNQRFVFPPQSMAYYNAAINVFKKDTLFLIFSDDIKWCKENFRGSNYFFVTGQKDIIDLFVMSKCNNNIISNSSFSWWGAWLNTNKNKIIICPDKWFGPAFFLKSSSYNDIYANEFTRLNTSTERSTKDILFDLYIYFSHNSLHKFNTVKRSIKGVIYRNIKKYL